MLSVADEVKLLKSNLEESPVDVNLRLGIILIQNFQNNEMASHHLRRVLDIDPTNDEANYVLGYISVMDNDWGLAKRYFANVLLEHPTCREAATMRSKGY